MVISYLLYQIDQVIFDQIMILTAFYLLDTSFLSSMIKTFVLVIDYLARIDFLFAHISRVQFNVLALVGVRS